MKKHLFLIFLFFTVSFAETQKEFIFETVEPTDKIVLPNEIIVENSVEITSEKPLPNWRFIADNNTIYFSEAIDKNQKINIKYSVKYSGISSSYGLNLPKFTEKKDENENTENITTVNLADTNKISFEGTKTIGASIGSNGEMAMEQSLFVEIYGQIDSNTKISAQINDQSSSLDGQTSEIGELDKIFLKVENPRWSAIAGDLEIKSGQNSILKEFYTPKGIFAELKNDEIGRINNAFAGISGTKTAYNRFEGIAGVQNGRFNLRPNANSGIVQIISGSVRVSLDSKLLEENEHYIVDYEMASVKFTAKTPILDGQIIEIHYKYRDFDYNSFSSGTQHKFSLLDSTLNFDVSVFFDKDIFSSSEREWTREEMNLLQNSGNESPKFLLGNKVHQNDVLKVQAYQRLYSLDKNQVYNWEAIPEDVFLKTDLYTVNFQSVEKDSGEYLPLYEYYYEELLAFYSQNHLDSLMDLKQNSAILGDIYLYVGKGNGTFTALGEISLPTQSVKGEISVNYNPSEQFSLNITVAGENFDRNTESKIDNNKNNSTGLKTDFLVSSDSDRNFLVKDKFSAVNAGEFFVDNILDKHELNNKWGIDLDVAKYSLWENMFYAGFHRYFLLKGGYGRANSKLENEFDDFNSQRISGGIESGGELPLDFDYLFTKINIKQGNRQNSDGRQQDANISFDFSKVDLNVFFKENWYERFYGDDFQKYYTGDFSTGISAENKDKTLGTTFQYKQTDSGDKEKHVSANADRREFLISGTADKETNDNHRIKADGSIILTEVSGKTSTNFLLSLLDRIYSDDYSKWLDTKWDLTVETRSENRWEYIKVPEGTGTHIKDTVTGNFVEFPFGDYIAQEISVHDDEGRYTTNTFGVSWHNQLKNVRLSGDFEASSKTKIINEWYQYVPIIPNFHKKLKDDVLYSNIFYNQYLSFLPADFLEISYDLRLGIGKSIDNSNVRQYLDGTHSFLYKWERFHLGLSNTGFIEQKKNESYSNNYDYLVRDINLQPLQNFVVLDWLHLFVEETGGLIYNNDVSGNYGEIRPGIKFLPMNAGTAEISYSYAQVNFDGELFYNMAEGFAKNDNHRISGMFGIKANEKLRFSGFVRGDKSENTMEKWRFSASLNAEIMIK